VAFNETKTHMHTIRCKAPNVRFE